MRNANEYASSLSEGGAVLYATTSPNGRDDSYPYCVDRDADHAACVAGRVRSIFRKLEQGEFDDIKIRATLCTRAST